MNITKMLMASFAFLCAAFLGSVQAADTSSTVNVRKVIESGDIPESGYVHVTATAASLPTGFTFDLPVPSGMTSDNIVGFQGIAYSVSGSTKPLNITRVGNVVTVSGSNATSGSTAVGDMVRGIVLYQ